MHTKTLGHLTHVRALHTAMRAAAALIAAIFLAVVAGQKPQPPPIPQTYHGFFNATYIDANKQLHYSGGMFWADMEAGAYRQDTITGRTGTNTSTIYRLDKGMVYNIVNDETCVQTALPFLHLPDLFLGLGQAVYAGRGSAVSGPCNKFSLTMPNGNVLTWCFLSDGPGSDQQLGYVSTTNDARGLNARMCTPDFETTPIENVKIFDVPDDCDGAYASSTSIST